MPFSPIIYLEKVTLLLSNPVYQVTCIQVHITDGSCRKTNLSRVVLTRARRSNQGPCKFTSVHGYIQWWLMLKSDRLQHRNLAWSSGSSLNLVKNNVVKDVNDGSWQFWSWKYHFLRSWPMLDFECMAFMWLRLMFLKVLFLFRSWPFANLTILYRRRSNLWPKSIGNFNAL